MRVLENKYEGDQLEVTCPHCSSKLAVEVTDIKYNEIAHRCSTFEVTCGACQKRVGIPARELPPGWMNRIEPEID